MELIGIKPVPNKKMEGMMDLSLDVANELGFQTRVINSASERDERELYNTYISPYQKFLEEITTTPPASIFKQGNRYRTSGTLILQENGETLSYAPWDLCYYDFLFEPTTWLSIVTVVSALKTANDAWELMSKVKKFISGVIKRRPKIEPDLIITSYGALDQSRLSDQEQAALRQFKRNKPIVCFTGWSVLDRGDIIDCGMHPHSIVLEGGSVLYRKSRSWKIEPLAPIDQVRQVKQAWVAVFDSIYSRLEEPILYSQGNQIGICVYVNPPEEVRREFPVPPPTTLNLDEFCKNLLARNVSDNDIIISGNRAKIRKTNDNLYAFEKTNAIDRYFSPYRITGNTKDYFEFELLPTDHALDRKKEILLSQEGGIKKIPQQISAIVADARKNVLRSEVSARIEGQTDVCIDIFAQRKEEAFSEAFLNELGFDPKKTNILYLSKGTRSDLPLIKKISTISNMNDTVFMAHGDSTTPLEMRHPSFRIHKDVDNVTDLLLKLGRIDNGFKIYDILA